MKMNEALRLVRDKYLEEQKGIKEGKITDTYKRACEDYPATMNTAHWWWARDMTKDAP